MKNNLEELYGPSASNADHKIGDIVSWADDSMLNGINSGTIEHIADQGGQVVYVVSSNTEVWPVEIAPGEIIER